jgi:hypothetical protein
MAIPGIGELSARDESLNHQIVDTFATVADSDRSWTEKVWGSVIARDGSVQIDFGLGSYRNRGVMDAFGGVSRGREQWTVRASRPVSAEPEPTVGPLAYQIVEPLRSIRYVLQDNEACDIAFDLTFTSILPPFFEERNTYRDACGRVNANVVRYHQAGTASGWVRVGSERIEVTPEEWFSFRDHSWGIRGEGAVGTPPTDIAPNPKLMLSEGSEIPAYMHWTPWVLRRPDGSFYGVHYLMMNVAGFRAIESAYVNHSDGRQERVRSVTPDLNYDKRTRFLQGGRVQLELASGEVRTVEVTALDETGFFLRPAGYGDWKGHKHGVWTDSLAVDGEYIADCHTPSVLPTLGQYRNKPVRLRDGDAEGFGIFETIITGLWPDLGLGPESNYGGY